MKTKRCTTVAVRANWLWPHSKNTEHKHALFVYSIPVQTLKTLRGTYCRLCQQAMGGVVLNVIIIWSSVLIARALWINVKPGMDN